MHVKIKNIYKYAYIIWLVGWSIKRDMCWFVLFHFAIRFWWIVSVCRFVLFCSDFSFCSCTKSIHLESSTLVLKATTILAIVVPLLLHIVVVVISAIAAHVITLALTTFLIEIVIKSVATLIILILVVVAAIIAIIHKSCILWFWCEGFFGLVKQ